MKLRDLLIPVSALLSACSYLPEMPDMPEIPYIDKLFAEKNAYYVDAKELEELQLPPGMSTAKVDDLYVLPPKVEGQLAIGDEVLRPNPIVTADAEQFVRVQALDGESWIVVELSTGQAWPRVRGFFEGNRLPLQQADGRLGTLETNWLMSKTNEELVERYQIEILPGVQANTAEIHVQQKSADRQSMETVELDWATPSDSEERERWMVMEIANFLAQDSGAASVSLLAAGISEVSRVKLVDDGRYPAYVELQLPFNRAWAGMGLALKKADFLVDDQDRSQGRYYVTYQPKPSEEEEEKGFWAGLFSSSDEQPEYFGEKFQVVVKPLRDGVVTIELLSERDGFPEDVRRTMLERIKSNIS